jgi:hypothetical protein
LPEFWNNLALAVSSYKVNSSVALEIFRLFLEAVEGKEIQIMEQNVADLSQVCTEFGFESLSRRISAFLDSSESASAVLKLEPELWIWRNEMYNKIVELRVSRRLARLAAIVSQMRTDFARLSPEV